jgi:hypothetical protein
MEAEDRLMDMRFPFPKRHTAGQTDGSALSARRKARLGREVNRYIERHLRARGVSRPEGEKETEGWHWIVLGSAPGRVGVVESGGDLYLHAEALVMDKLPSDRELMLPLMRELLEKNAGLPDAVRLVIANDRVFAMLTRRISSLSEAEVGRSIDSVMVLADELDDGFAAKYGGTSRKRGR